MTAPVVAQDDASPQARGKCTAVAGEVRVTTTVAIQALVGMTVLVKGETGLVTGRAFAALRGYQKTKASASIATQGSRGLDADIQRNKVIVGTMEAGEGNRVATMTVMDQVLRWLGSGGSRMHMHIQLNKDLLAAARSVEHLCAIVGERLQDFNAVNAATVCKSLLLMRTSCDMRNVCDMRARNEALLSLERVLRDQHVQVFGARECANTLHTLAKTQGWRPCVDLLRGLESLALQVQGAFNPQDIVNTLWAFATLGL